MSLVREGEEDSCIEIPSSARKCLSSQNCSSCILSSVHLSNFCFIRSVKKGDTFNLQSVKRSWGVMYVVLQDTNTDLTLKLQYIIRNMSYYRHMNGRATFMQPGREAHISIYTNIYLLNYTKVAKYFTQSNANFLGGCRA